MASEQYEAFMTSLESPLVSAADSLEVARDKLEAMHGHPVADTTSVEWVMLGDVRCAWVAVADTPQDAAVARGFGAEGIGLCRTEHMFFEPGRILAVREMILASDSEARQIGGPDSSVISFYHA